MTDKTPHPAVPSNVAVSSKVTVSPQIAVLPWLGSFLRPYRNRVMLAVLFLLIGSLSWLVLGQGGSVVLAAWLGNGNQQRRRYANLTQNATAQEHA